MTAYDDARAALAAARAALDEAAVEDADVQITATQRFRHGDVTYEDDEVYLVPSADATYFVIQGWAVET